MLVALPLIMVALGAASAAAQGPTPPAPAPAPTSTTPIKVLVLDVKGPNPDLDVVIRDVIVSELQTSPQLDVVSSEDMRRVLDLEASKEALGCGDDSCLAELASAMGARFLVYATATQLGVTTSVSINVYDSDNNKAAGRESLEVASNDAVPNDVRGAIRRIFGGVGIVLARADTASSPSGLFIAGASVAGLGAGVAGVAGVISAVYSSSVTSAPAFVDKKAAAEQRDWWLVGAGVGVGVATIGVAVVAIDALIE